MRIKHGGQGQDIKKSEQLPLFHSRLFHPGLFEGGRAL
jgi:hypothetical protein